MNESVIFARSASGDEAAGLEAPPQVERTLAAERVPHGLKRGELPPTSWEVGPLIREERRKRKWSQNRLAEESGITQPAVSFIESQQCFSKLETIERIALALGWEPEALLAEARRRSRLPAGKI